MTDDAENTILVTVDRSLYSVGAVQRAAFRFAEQYATELDAQEGSVLVRLRPRSGVAHAARDTIESFNAALLDEQLREIIRAETAAISNILIATAFERAAPRAGSGQPSGE